MAYTTLVSGTTITASWANTVRDQQISAFASTAARDSAVSTPVAGMVCYTSDTDTFWHYTGSKWMRQAKTTQVGTLQTYTTTAMADIPNCTFPGDANSTYAFRAWFHTVAPTASDLSVQWTLPASAGIEWSLLGPSSVDAGAEATTVWQSVIITAGPLTLGGMASVGTVGQPMGWISIGATPGTCKMQASQGTAGGSSFIRASSWFEVEQLT